MEGLLAEINKRKATDFADADGGARKYVRRGDLERQKHEEEQRRREEERKRKEEEEEAKRKKEGEAQRSRMRKEAESIRKASLARMAAESESATPDTGTPAPEGSEAAEKEKEKFNISADECIRRLRAKGQPIRLFGETDKERRLRLRALELLGDRGKVDQNDFKKAVETLQVKEMERKARGEPESKEKRIRGIMNSEPIDLGLIKTDFNKLHPLIYWAFKDLLKEWEEWLDARPDDVKRTAAGKLAAANHAQSAQNLKPLFRMLRNRDLPEDVVRHLAEVVHFVQRRLYQQANDAYLRLSIGNAAWPLGVTSVGIHERSSDSKITDNIAHVLNDEVSRKYIQAVKRLLTFSQMVRPPEIISQAMG